MVFRAAICGILLPPLLLSACEKTATVTTENKSNASIVAEVGDQARRMDKGEVWVKEFDLGRRWLVFGPGDKTVEVRANGKWVRSYYRALSLTADGNGVADVRSNAGILRIENRAENTIDSVSVIAKTDTTFRGNWLKEPIEPGRTGDVVVWAGEWQALIVDVSGASEKVPGITIRIEEVRLYAYHGF
jgi:hypothetical protein